MEDTKKLRRKLGEEQKSLAKAKETIQTLKSRNAQMTGELKDSFKVSDEYDRLASTLEDARSQHKKVKLEYTCKIQNLESELDEKSDALKQSVTETAKLQHLLEKVRTKMAKIESRYKEVSTKVLELEGENTNVREKYKKCKAETKALSKQLEEHRLKAETDKQERLIKDQMQQLQQTFAMQSNAMHAKQAEISSHRPEPLSSIGSSIEQLTALKNAVTPLFQQPERRCSKTRKRKSSAYDFSEEEEWSANDKENDDVPRRRQRREQTRPMKEKCLAHSGHNDNSYYNESWSSDDVCKALQERDLGQFVESLTKNSMLTPVTFGLIREADLAHITDDQGGALTDFQKKVILGLKDDMPPPANQMGGEKKRFRGR